MERRRRLRRALGAAALVALGFLALPEAVLAHGDAVPRSELASSWEAAPIVLVALAVAAVLFASAFVRLRRRGRGDLAPATRPLLFALGISLMALAVMSPLDAIGEEYLLSGHMLQHVLLVDAGPALVLVAIRGPLTFFLLPPLLLRRLASLAWLRSFLGFVLRPAVSFVLWAVVIAAWHVPAAYDAVLANQPLHDFEHASFVLVGFLVWAQLVDPARRRALTVAGRIGFAFLIFASGMVLADVLIFSFEPLYGAYAAQDERLFGLSPRLDQQLAGLVMLVEQTLTLGACVALLLLVRHRETSVPEAPPVSSVSREAAGVRSR